MTRETRDLLSQLAKRAQADRATRLVWAESNPHIFLSWSDTAIMLHMRRLALFRSTTEIKGQIKTIQKLRLHIQSLQLK